MSTHTNYPQRRLGAEGPLVSAIRYGAMGMLLVESLEYPDSEREHQGIGAFYGTSSEDEALETLTYCADRGLTFWVSSRRPLSCIPVHHPPNTGHSGDVWLQYVIVSIVYIFLMADVCL